MAFRNWRQSVSAALVLSPGRTDKALLDVCGGQLNSLRHRHLGFPIQSFSGLGNIQIAVFDFSGPLGDMLRLKRSDAQGSADRVENFVIGGGFAKSYVEDFLLTMVQGLHICSRNVSNIDIIARFRAISKDLWSNVLQHLFAENCNHASLPLRTLPRTVDITVA